MTYNTILFERDATDAFATITLNRPDKLNAMDGELLDELDAAVRRAVADPAINALIITGSGRAFTTGYDLNSDDFELDVEGWRDNIAANCERLLTIWQAPIPIVAAVNGYALAGGLELMMCCDLAVAAEDARFGEPEVRHASAPPSLAMPWLVPMRHTRMLMYTGDLIDAREAHRIHLVNSVVPAQDLKRVTEALARKLARMPLPAIKFAKAALNHQQLAAGFQTSFDFNRETTATLHATNEGRRWMRMLKEMPLSQFLKIREEPFADLDRAQATETRKG
ncbi:enoyl-CoA hydratase/isomerase family protein [Mesorhizobium sp. CAU 1732]|uniref:enoyl-CoA hydratase/isomerase family protein n=1 Tax=Mesorhizobium sp. CAU 1732 TaxID=3140358 RepID=UPI00326046D5